MFRLQRKHLLLLFPVAALAWQLLAVRAGDPLVPITLPGESKALDGRLKYARSLVLDKKWSDAIDTYAGILRDVGDKLIPVETPLDAVSSESRSLQVRRQCHLDIAALPKVALQKYRASVKFQTRGWLEAGIKNRDEEPLLRIVREAFCASEGDQALDFLGDLAFEKGEFHQALQWWLMLTMPATEVLGTKDTPPAKDKTPDGRLLFPNPQVDVARVRAKIIMAYLFDGNEFQAQAEFAAFEKLHADAAGHFAAEKGKYVAILKTWLDKGSPSFDRDLSWPTFAGDAARNAAGAKLPHKRLWAEGPTWSISLDDTPAGSAATSMPMAEKARRLACYPVITGERVLVHDGTSIQLIGLIGGQKLDSYALPKGLYTLPTKPNADKWLPRHTLTVAGKKAYAILGDAHHALAVNGIRPGRKNYLVCLDLAGNDATSLKPAWQILADAKDEEAAIFEGTPLVHEGRVYAILSRAKGLQVTARVVCLDADTGKQLWQEELARFTEAEDAVPVAVVDQPMLTLAGNQLVYCSQRGVIQALDARTGAQGWAVKYPSRGPVTIEGTPSPRDLSPCIYAEGRVHAAPMDTDRVLCLDAETGQVQWERDRIQVVHLVGCRYGKLLFTTADGLRVVDARTGSDKSGWLQPAAGRLPPLGRGVLLGGWLLWPTQDPKYSLRVVHHSDGNPHHDDLTFSPVQTRFIKPGNMAFANGCLVVAGNHELTGYVAPKHLLKKNEKDAAGPKPPPPALYRLAQSEADAGHLGAALKHFREAEKALTPKTWDQELLQWKCLVARQDLLLTAAREEKDTKKAVKWLEMATATEFPADMRLTAQVKIAERWQAAKEYEKAVSAYQAMLDDEKMRMAAIWYWPFGKTAATPWRGADIAQWRIYQSTYDHGQQIYRAIEEKAKHLASQAVGEKTIPVLEKLIQQYPSSQTVSKFWLNLAKAYEARKEFAAAINVYLLQRRHYVFFGDKQQVAEYVKESFALALTYEKEDCWEAARGIWEGLKTHSPDAAAPGIFPNQTVAQFVAQRIAQPEYNASKVEAEKDVQEPDLQLPLSTKWTTTATGLIIRGHANYWSKSHQWFFTGAGNDLSLAGRSNRARLFGTSVCRFGRTGWWRTEGASWLRVRRALLHCVGMMRK